MFFLTWKLTIKNQVILINAPTLDICCWQNLPCNSLKQYLACVFGYSLFRVATSDTIYISSYFHFESVVLRTSCPWIMSLFCYHDTREISFNVFTNPYFFYAWNHSSSTSYSHLSHSVGLNPNCIESRLIPSPKWTNIWRKQNDTMLIYTYIQLIYIGNQQLYTCYVTYIKKTEAKYTAYCISIQCIRIYIQ